MAAADDPDLDERHWTYLDRFADVLTGRGPTLSHDRKTWTGSIHILDLPDVSAARAFVVHEPYHRAGAYVEHRIWRFDNLLGRTMWQFAGPVDGPLVFVLAPPRSARPVHLDLAPDLAGRLVVAGILSDPEQQGAAGDGLAVAAHAADHEALLALVGAAVPAARTRHHTIHDWALGGRR